MFKIGDKVICIDDTSIINGTARYIKKGETYTVVEIEKNAEHPFIKIKNKKETFDYWYKWDRFEKKE